MARPNKIDLFMSIAAPRGEREESFEERRVEDYLKAYTTIGRPPAPCPPEPTAAHARAALGLPPIFQPRAVESDPRSPQTNGQAHPNGILGALSDGAMAKPGALPDVHVFRACHMTEEGNMPAQPVVFQSIVLQDEFLRYSFEELRHAAYLKGLKFVPEAAIPQLPAAPPLQAALGSEEKCQSITCDDLYAKHSFEELRLAFLRAGRQLTSAEIMQRGADLKLP